MGLECYFNLLAIDGASILKGLWVVAWEQWCHIIGARIP